VNAYAAQCLLCKHAQRRGNMVVGCLRFEESSLPIDVSAILAALLYQIAGKERCVAREALEFGPDAYMAEDLPLKENP
jgi:hypothetical protein